MSINSSVDLGWYAPSNTRVTNLNDVINGTGVYGFIFNSSTDPPGSPYGTYNWCNMPHVRPQEYKKADSEYHLEYVELVCFLVGLHRLDIELRRFTGIIREHLMLQTPFQLSSTPGTAQMKACFTMENP
jgi:hypothetical protein